LGLGIWDLGFGIWDLGFRCVLVPCSSVHSVVHCLQGNESRKTRSGISDKEDRQECLSYGVREYFLPALSAKIRGHFKRIYSRRNSVKFCFGDLGNGYDLLDDVPLDLFDEQPHDGILRTRRN
jgi:hypothetical protein